MHSVLADVPLDLPLAAIDWMGWLNATIQFIKVLIGFSLIIFVHELGHFLAAKWCGVRVDRFAVGFGTRLFGWRKGEGFSFGNRPNYTPEELDEKQYGETDYCFKALPFGGYVKMLGEGDIDINEETGEIKMGDDPRSFTNKPVGSRMLVVSAGVVFNMLFAALAFMAVFLIGMEMPAPIVGAVEVDGAAAAAGLLPGDEIIEINGDEIPYFQAIQRYAVLSDGKLNMKVRRNDEIKEFVVDPTYNKTSKLQSIGIESAMDPTVMADADPVGDRPALKKDDRILSIGDVPITESIQRDLVLVTRTLNTPVIPASVKRPVADGTSRTETVFLRNELSMLPSAVVGAERNEALASRHLLGLTPRVRVTLVAAGTPAAEAGMQDNDVIVQWGPLVAPTASEVLESIAGNEGTPIPVIVLRDGQQHELELTPELDSIFGVFGKGKRRVGIGPGGLDDRHPVVADIVPNTPAAALGMPRGAEVVAVDGQSVADWFEIYRVLRSAVGRTVPVQYRVGESLVTADLAVPSSIVDGLKLPPDARILSVGGERHVKINDQDVRVASEAGLRLALKEHIGKRVEVRYREDSGFGPEHVVHYEVTADNYDPWQWRVAFSPDFGVLRSRTTIVDAGGNPFKAMWMGIELAMNFVTETYQTMKQVARRKVGTESISGPIGIFSVAIKQAEAGYAQLLFFLAFLSVNLAVINFLPLPVVDGGLMVFLIIEKLKGKPLSIKTQMVSTIVGLALIGLVFIYVTFQDISKLL